ncbi:MAG: type II toxin-antitoxin system VapC family toxin [Alphaproteobacteria bacterium]|nr:type II toxin-antitoxin system VapC family toxin [Alphaproteobacteria bacterium]
MIVIDTNVISELMRGEPDPAVLDWVTAQPRALLYTTYVNQAEILYGIAALPAGRRRTALATAAEAMFAEDFAGRVLPFEARAAARYSEIVIARRHAGKPIEKFDALIAATALAAGASIATRDTGGFAGCGLTVIDPWTA